MISDVSAIIILIANPLAVDLARGLHPEDDNKDSEGCRPPAEKQAGEGSVPEDHWRIRTEIRAPLFNR